MITLRKAAERGQFDHGWLDTRHTFSFADYSDPAFMGFRSLRVINEDRVQPEMNASDSETTHFLQIWITPERAGIEPGYEQKAFPDREGRLRLVASHDGRDGSLMIHQDVDLFAAQLDGQPLRHDFQPGRFGWLQVARGSVTVNGIELTAGDGAAIEGEPALTISGKGAEVLLFDLA